MGDYSEYRNSIKKMVKEYYEEDLTEIGLEDIYIAFYDKIKLEELKDNFIFITDFQDMAESIKKIYYYLKILEREYQVIDIYVFKSDDRINYTEKFLGSFFCVKKSIYQSNRDKYDTIFAKSIKNTNRIKAAIKDYVSTQKRYLIDINSMFKNPVNISKIYVEIIEQTVEYNKEIEKKVRKNFITDKTIETCIDDKSITRNIFIENTGIEILGINETGKKELHKSNKLIRKTNNKYYRKVMLTKNHYKAIIIINIHNLEKTKKYIEILDSMNIGCIIINHTIKDRICIKSIFDAILITKGNKVGLITAQKTKNLYKDIIEIQDLDEKNINIDGLKQYFANNKNLLNIFANLDNVNSIKVLTGTFLNYDGTNYYSGGAERYLIDLHKVCKDIGYKLRIYQKANFNFVRKYQDIEVVGLSNNQKYNEEYRQVIQIYKKYKEIAEDTTKLSIYSAFLECIGKNIKPSIGVSHGVAWDNPYNVYDRKYFGPFDKGWIIDAARRCDKIVSVDTNTANYFQTVDYELGNQTEVIPNYVDMKEFYPVEKNNKNIVILFPRRLNAPRGLYMLLEVVDKVLEQHNNVEIRLVGKGFDEDLIKIDKKVKKWGEDKIKVYNKPPTEMHQEYKEADISLIPTLYNEGTSLSCLEAMASGNAVIATRIGGLTDLIINNYNGKLIEPNAKSLYEAIEDFLNNEDLVKKCKHNAIEVAKSFSKEKWEQSWKNIISNFAKKSDETNNISLRIAKIYVKRLKNAKVNQIILKYLMEGYLVYVISMENKWTDSYARLQYINVEDELYCKPDIVLAEKGIDYAMEDNVQYMDL